MSETYKAAVLTEQGHAPKLTLQTLPTPTPSPSQVLIRLSLTSLCGTDCALASGHLGPTLPVLGHEGVGRIASLGASATTINPSLAVGQRVGVAWQRDACGECTYCRTPGGETRCASKSFSGVKFAGTFAQYTLVPARHVLVLPEDLADEAVAPILCGGVTAYKALKVCCGGAGGLVPGQWVAVSGGGGGVGAFVVAFARAMGFRVVAVDAGSEKGQYATAEGAEAYVDITEEKEDGGVAAVKKVTGGEGAAAVVVCAGVGQAYQAALGMLAPFGTFMCVGIPPPSGVVSVHPLQMIDHGWRILGSSVGTGRDILEALEFVRRGLVVPKVQWAELGDMAQLMDDVMKGKVQGKYVINLDKA